MVCRLVSQPLSQSSNLFLTPFMIKYSGLFLWRVFMIIIIPIITILSFHTSKSLLVVNRYQWNLFISILFTVRTDFSNANVWRVTVFSHISSPCNMFANICCIVLSSLMVIYTATAFAFYKISKSLWKYSFSYSLSLSFNSFICSAEETTSTIYQIGCCLFKYRKLLLEHRLGNLSEFANWTFLLFQQTCFCTSNWFAFQSLSFYNFIFSNISAVNCYIIDSIITVFTQSLFSILQSLRKSLIRSGFW